MSTDFRDDYKMEGVDHTVPICFRTHTRHSRSNIRTEDFATREEADAFVQRAKATGAVTCMVPLYPSVIHCDERHKLLEKWHKA